MCGDPVLDGFNRKPKGNHSPFSLGQVKQVRVILRCGNDLFGGRGGGQITSWGGSRNWKQHFERNQLIAAQAQKGTLGGNRKGAEKPANRGPKLLKTYPSTKALRRILGAVDPPAKSV